MKLQVKGRNTEVSDSIRGYAQEKLGKLERQLQDPTRVELELTVERNPSIAENQIAEATIWTKGPILRAKESSNDMKTRSTSAERSTRSRCARSRSSLSFAAAMLGAGGSAVNDRQRMAGRGRGALRAP